VRVALVDPPGYTPQYDDRLAAALAARGHAVDLLTARFLYGELPEPEGYRREEVCFRLSARLFAGRPRSPLRRPVKAFEYVPSMWALRRRMTGDVAHFQWLARPGLDVRWLRRLSLPRVYTAHNATLRQGPEKRDLWRDVLRAFDRVVVHSHRGLERLEELGVDRTRLVRIPHPAFDAAAGETTPPSGRTLLFFGLIRRHKGLDVLIRALPDIPDARLVVAGDEVDPVAPLHALAGALGVAGRIEWRLGYLPQDEVDALMREAALAVLPYREADASGVLATALGHGRPCVVSDVGTLGETVREFGAGEVVPPGDVAALATACVRVLSDLGPSAAGAARARAELTWAASAAAHERMYRELLRG
jgi:glycosyltransferase involved in cell wall biosynthesis